MKRIQRQRLKGWRMPPNTVYVGRPSRWGNLYRLGERFLFVEPGVFEHRAIRNRTDQVAAFRQGIDLCTEREIAEWIGPLRGKNLACWCPLDQPCHADILLELAR